MESENKDHTILSHTVSNWVHLDNEMQRLQERIKLIREQKHEISQNIITTLEQNNRTNVVMDIPDGHLRIQTRKEYGSLTFKYVEECLLTLIPDEEQRKFVMEYLRTKREVKEVQEIKRQYKK
jgi:hypothetical protein